MKKFIFIFLISIAHADVSLILYTGYGFTGDGPDQILLNPGESALVEVIHAGDNGYSDSKSDNGIGGAFGDDVVLTAFTMTASETPATDFSGYAYIAGMEFNFQGIPGGRIFVRLTLSDGRYFDGHVQDFPNVDFNPIHPPTPTTYNFGGNSGNNKSHFTMVLNASAPIDTDMDGLSDVLENEYNTDPNNADTDGDDLIDGYEVNTSYTDPSDPDSDDDGLSDGYEVNTSSTDPNNPPSNEPSDPDSDDDGLSDGYEVNTSSTNPNNADTDSDGLSDGYEVNTSSTNPNNADTDSDGLSDGDEINTYSTDPNDADSDDDGFNDGDEVSGLDPTTPNTDIFNSVESKMKDLRVGSQTFGVSNGNAKIRMYVDESGNLTDWTNTPHVLELDIPADSDTKFFRFRTD